MEIFHTARGPDCAETGAYCAKSGKIFGIFHRGIQSLWREIFSRRVGRSDSQCVLCGYFPDPLGIGGSARPSACSEEPGQSPCADRLYRLMTFRAGGYPDFFHKAPTSCGRISPRTGISTALTCEGNGDVFHRDRKCCERILPGISSDHPVCGGNLTLICGQLLWKR